MGTALARTDSEILLSSLEAPALDPILLTVANETLEGLSIDSIASNHNVSPDTISQILDKKEVKSYLDNVYLSRGYLNRYKKLNLINEIIDQKVAEAVETGVYSQKALS